MPYEFTDANSCADIGLIVTGCDNETLFRDAAEGLVSIMVEPESLGASAKISIKLTAANPEELFYKWLSEIIYYKDAEMFFPKRYVFNRLDESGRELDVVLHGDKADREKHLFKTDVKAVTYYRFRVEKSGNLWKAEVVLDI